MATSSNAYIVGMSDTLREELVGSLRQVGYRVSQTDPHVRVLTRADRRHNQPGLAVVDVAELTPDGVERLSSIRDERPGATVVLMSRRASQAMTGDDLPDGIWGLVSKTASVRSLQDLVNFLGGGPVTVH